MTKWKKTEPKGFKDRMRSAKRVRDSKMQQTPKKQSATSRPSSVKRGTKKVTMRPGGYEVEAHKYEATPGQTNFKTSIEDQDITPNKQSFEQTDDEGMKYLNYKSISGMDLAPRIRHPTPPKHYHEPDVVDDNCKSCSNIKDRFKTVLNENQEIKQELEKLKAQVERMKKLNPNLSNKKYQTELNPREIDRPFIYQGYN